MESPRQLERIVVLGAGPGGLCAAWNLALDGRRVVVFEREPVCGGQSITFERGGFHYDLGPHNIHSQRPSVIGFLGRALGSDFLEWRYRAQIQFRGRRVNYPLLGSQVLQFLPWATSAACAASFGWGRVLSLFTPTFRDDGTYERWVVNRFGRRFYDIFFGPYTEKTWGIPPSQLSDIVARKRIAVRNLTDLIKGVLFKTTHFHPENTGLVTNYFPRLGVGQIADHFAEGIRRAGGEIRLNASVTRVETRAGRVCRIRYRQGEEEAVLDLDAEGGAENWCVLTTLPVNEFAQMLDPAPPEEVLAAARGLDFTSTVFLYLNLDSTQAFEVPVLYFSESEFPQTRITDMGRFSRDMMPPGKTSLCVELTCSVGDDTWNADDATLFERVMGPLEANGLLARRRVESYHTRRLRHAYPRFRVGYQEKIRAIVDHLSSLSNVTTFGRQGLFCYANVDDAIWMGFQVAKHVQYRERLPLPMDELLPDYIDF
ncbi:FAD-dependent oxidoreductase [Candidatus Sumerlaeota bacterium]|nr:FAD-dependent oxidoreductase [Candidatus Sumerlaeota bacterium]